MSLLWPSTFRKKERTTHVRLANGPRVSFPTLKSVSMKKFRSNTKCSTIKRMCSEMKRVLFIDNFRGFANTYIPIVDVNFLVGENSTGKTSVLGLLKLFSNPNFLVSGDFFHDDDVKFGNYNDMVSAHAADRTSFRIGMIDEVTNSKSGVSTRSMLLTYKEHNGLPKLSRLSCSIGPRIVHLIIGEKQISFRTDDFPQNATPAQAIPEWIREHGSSGSRYTSLPTRLGNIPLFLALSWAERPPKDEKTPTFELSSECRFRKIT